MKIEECGYTCEAGPLENNKDWMQLKAELDFLKVLAAKPLAEDEDEWYNPCDAGGGNYDDVYYNGLVAGETYLARGILDRLGFSYNDG